MDFLQLAKQRFSCRNYQSTPVEEEKLMKVLEAARVAPSAVNYQPWQIYVYRHEQNKTRITEAYHRDWLKNAPVILVVCGNHQVSWKRIDGKDYTDVDISIAIDHMTLQATDLGLGTCWICNFNYAKLREIMNLPDHMEPIAILPLGYPVEAADPERHTTKRKPLEEIVKWEML